MDDGDLIALLAVVILAHHSNPEVSDSVSIAEEIFHEVRSRGWTTCGRNLHAEKAEAEAARREQEDREFEKVAAPAPVAAPGRRVKFAFESVGWKDPRDRMGGESR
jgi:hypothetical protein